MNWMRYFGVLALALVVVGGINLASAESPDNELFQDNMWEWLKESIRNWVLDGGLATVSGGGIDLNGQHFSLVDGHYQINSLLFAMFDFGSNSFNGSGNFNTTGNLTGGYVFGNVSNAVGFPVEVDTNFSSCAVGEYGDGDGSCYSLNDSIDAFTSSVYYNATSIETITYTVDTGDVDSIKVLGDNNYYNVSEVGGSSGYTLINFTGVVDFNTFIVDMRYDGLHDMHFGLYDCDEGEYEYEYGEVVVNGFRLYGLDVFDSTEHICGGNVSLRINHDENGNVNDDYYLDYVVLVKGFSASSNNLHSALLDLHFDESGHFGNLNDTGYNATFDNFFGRLVGDWSGNDTGLVKDWNSTGLIQNWSVVDLNVTGLVKNWSVVDLNATGLVKDWNLSGYIQNWSNVISSGSDVTSYRNLTEFNASFSEEVIDALNSSLDDDLKYYYALEESSGAVVDAIGNKNMTNDGGTPQVSGMSDYGYSFVTNDNFDMSGASWSAGSKSLSFWFNLDNYGSASSRLISTEAQGDLFGCDIETSKEYIQMFSSGSGTFGDASGHIITGQWYHVVITVNVNGTILLYLNGTRLYEDTDANSDELTAWEFGARGSSQFVNGDVDEIGMWEKVLSDSEVVELYGSRSPPTYPFSYDNSYNVTYNNTFNFNDTVLYAKDFVVLSRIFDGNAISGLKKLKIKDSGDVGFSDIDYSGSLLKGRLGFGYLLKAMVELIFRVDSLDSRISALEGENAQLKLKVDKMENPNKYKPKTNNSGGGV